MYYITLFYNHNLLYSHYFQCVLITIKQYYFTVIETLRPQHTHTNL